jgi:hypothetical protein
MHEGKRWTCGFCGKIYTQKPNYEKHLIVYTDPEDVTCDTCGKLFATPWVLENHKQAMHNNVKHKCDQCNKEYKNPSSLHVHKVMVHKADEAPHKCPTCDVICKSPSDLERHMSRHNKDVQLKCDEEKCTYVGNSEVNLKAHKKRVHIDPHKFKCEEEGCSAGFRDKHGLTRHVNSSAHKNLREFECEICHRSFTRKEGLEEHKVYHNGLRQFKCLEVYCDATHVTQNALKKHYDEQHSTKAQRTRKKEEQRTHDFFLSQKIKFTREKQIDFDSGGSSLCKRFARLDFIVHKLRSDCDVILEVDERQHEGDYQCDSRRCLDVRHATMLKGWKLPQLWFRYNPNAFRLNGVLQVLNKDKREQILLQQMKSQPTPSSEGGVAVVYLFYDVDKDGLLTTQQEPDYPEDFKQFVRTTIVAGDASLSIPMEDKKLNNA